jgi:RNase P/RNase MRP subunit p29
MNEPDIYDVFRAIRDMSNTNSFKPTAIILHPWDAYNMRVDGKRIIKRLPRKLKKRMKKYYLRA